MAADQLHLTNERRLQPPTRPSCRIAQIALEAQSVQRQRPSGRQHWTGNGRTTRREEGRGRLCAADRRAIAGPRHRVGSGSGLTDDGRHGRRMRGGHQRTLIARSTLGGRRILAIDVVKGRDLCHDLEETIDAAEDAAEVMERMYHKAN